MKTLPLGIQSHGEIYFVDMWRVVTIPKAQSSCVEGWNDVDRETMGSKKMADTLQNRGRLG